ncbi:MAG TPA: hypothetical protein PL143_20580, partial [Rhodocyclaceae bacterium]|nr:hypothetical protein [Rhodocyclaceae bacterium]
MDRMQVIYRVRATPTEIDARARAIAVEQSIEMPPHAVRNPRVDEHIVGRVEHIAPHDDAHFLVTIGLALETTGCEAGQLMNMLFGNSSLHPDVALVDLAFPPGAAARFGPDLRITPADPLTGSTSIACGLAGTVM